MGEREAGAMLMGDKIIWNRTAMYTRTNNSAPAVPDWATFFTAILVGGGAGGQAGNGGVGSQGSGVVVTCILRRIVSSPAQAYP